MNSRFKNISLKQVALIITLVVFIASTIGLTIHLLLKTELNYLSVVIFSITQAILTFVSVYYFVDKFIYRRIKVLYKLISTQKGAKDVSNVLEEDDVIASVEQEVKDFTDRKSSEIAQLKKMEEYRKEFIGNVSHELKTPIFNAQGYIETLRDGGIKDSTINKKYLKKASKNLDRLKDIVEDLVTLSKYEADVLKVEESNFDIVELVKEVFEAHEIIAEQNNIELSIKKEMDMPKFVVADRAKIEQVLTNLISNSVKYGNEGGSTKAGFYDVDNKVLIEISDDGPGIEKHHLSRLFERFYRVDKSRSRNQGGTGLGLAIVKHILEAHEESINVRSTFGIGTTFGFTLNKTN